MCEVGRPDGKMHDPKLCFLLSGKVLCCAPAPSAVRGGTGLSRAVHHLEAAEQPCGFPWWPCSALPGAPAASPPSAAHGCWKQKLLSDFQAALWAGSGQTG